MSAVQMTTSALDLLLRRRANIGCRDNGAQTPRRSYRLETGDPRSHHQHARRLYRAGGGHHHRKGPSELIGSLERGFVAGEIGLGGESIHRLRTRNSRQEFDGERDDPGAGTGGRQHIGIAAVIDEAHLAWPGGGQWRHCR